MKNLLKKIYNEVLIMILPSGDAYGEAIYAVRIAEGLFFKLNPDEGFSTFPAGYFHPFLYALIYKLSFNNRDFFILNIVIFNTIIFFLTLFVVRNIYFKYFSEKSKVPLILLSLSPPFLFNFYLTLNFPIFTLLFYLCIYYVERKRVFLFFFFLLVLTRPEGFIIIFFHFFYFYIYKKIKTREYIPFYFSAFLVSLVPFLINKILTGYLFSTAVRAQSIFNYFPYNKAIIVGFKRFLYHFLSVFWGFPFVNIEISPFLHSVLYPPLFLFFVSFYLFKEKKYILLYLPFLIIFLFILFIDSFTYFTGVHFSRHIAYFYPIIIFMFYKGLIKFSKYFLRFYILYFGLFFSFFGKGFFSLFEKTKISKNSAIISGEIIPPGEEVLVFSDPCFFYYNMDKLKIRFLSPSFSLLTSMYTKSFKDWDSILYVIDNYHDNVKYYYYSKPDIPEKLIEERFKKVIYSSEKGRHKLYIR